MIWDELTNRLCEVYEREEAKNVVKILLEDAFGLSSYDLITKTTYSVDVDLLEGYMKRLLNHEPVQYVVGKAFFYENVFQVNEHVLIPRPETEELVDLVIQENRGNRHMNILDVGTGSGCIGISVDLNLPNCHITGTDISERSLQVAKTNALSLSSSAMFLKHDILKDSFKEHSFDIIVSNPPYIPYQERGVMHDNVLGYEPHLALFVKDGNPLEFYMAIAQKGNEVLKKRGKLYFEIHEQYGERVRDLLVSLGYHSVSVKKDLQGKDRIVSAIF